MFRGKDQITTIFFPACYVLFPAFQSLWSRLLRTVRQRVDNAFGSGLSSLRAPTSVSSTCLPVCPLNRVPDAGNG